MQFTSAESTTGQWGLAPNRLPGWSRDGKQVPAPSATVLVSWGVAQVPCWRLWGALGLRAAGGGLPTSFNLGPNSWQVFQAGEGSEGQARSVTMFQGHSLSEDDGGSSALLYPSFTG